MVAPRNVTPSFKRERITVAVVEEKFAQAIKDHGPTDSWTSALNRFLGFLRSLDWTRTEMYHEQESNSGGWRSGWRVVHFTKPLVDQPGYPDDVKWHDSWGQTWFGLGAGMS